MSQQQALSQVSYIQEYMSRAIKSAVLDAAGDNCVPHDSSDKPQYYSFSNIGGKSFDDSIQFLNGSDIERGYPICDKFYLDTDGFLKEKKAYGPNYDMNLVDPVALSSSDFKISSIRFAIDGLNQKVLSENRKPFLLADADKNYLGNIFAFISRTQLAIINSPTPTPMQSPTPTLILGCTNPNATNYNPSATQNDGSCILQSCITDDDCDVYFRCNSNGFCINPSNYSLPSGVCGSDNTQSFPTLSSMNFFWFGTMDMEFRRAWWNG